jgi:DNA-binding transcriptional MerR regulator
MYGKNGQLIGDRSNHVDARRFLCNKNNRTLLLEGLDAVFFNSDLARLSGAPPHTIRYWSQTHVLEAVRDQTGSGHHRQFSKAEAVIATIVQYFSSRGLQVEHLADISKTLRAALLSDEWAWDCLNGAIRGDFKVFMVVPDQGLEHGWISLYSTSPPIHNGKPLTQPIIATIDGEAKTVMVIRPATQVELAAIFGQMTDENPGVMAVLLNTCLARLRTEWNERR